MKNLLEEGCLNTFKKDSKNDNSCFFTYPIFFDYLDYSRKMKQLRSSFKDFRQIFDQGLSVRYIAEPLFSFDSKMDAEEVCKIMEQKAFDVAGIREGGTITGMVFREKLGRGILKEFKEEINNNSYIQDWEPMLNVLESLKKHQHLI